MDKLFALYKILFDLHVQTKTVDSQFHEKSASFYESVFDIVHQISEKQQDIGVTKPIDCDVAKKKAYDTLVEVKNELETMVKGKNSIGMDNLLRGLIDSIEGDIGNAMAFIKEEEEETKEEEDRNPFKKPNPLSSKL